MMYRRWIMRRRVTRVAEEAGLAAIAKKLFKVEDKNPYYLGEQAIKNFEELRGSLDKFTESEAQWVASWIEYLGDAKTAARIRQSPNRFKEIIADRYNELKPYALARAKLL